MTEMQKETMLFIDELLDNEVKTRKRDMMIFIHGGNEEHIKEYVTSYREAYKAYRDFSDFYFSVFNNEVMGGD